MCATPHVDALTVSVVEVEVAGQLLIGRWPNKVAVRLLLGVGEKLAWHRRRSLRRRRLPRSDRHLHGPVLDENA